MKSLPVARDSKKYLKRGVSSAKEEVHSAIKNMDKGVFPGAFCKAIENPYGDKNFVYLMHADGAGTKSSLAYLYWKETGDSSVFKGIAQDALIMNLDDLLCVGAIGPYSFSSTIGRNKSKIPSEIIARIITGTQEQIELLNQYGADIKSLGGETADIGDLVQTLVVDATMGGIVPKDNFINARNIAPNMVIVGLASFGQATYEAGYNAGIGSNGLTGARHDLFQHIYYQKYPETFDKDLEEDLIYCGDYLLKDELTGTNISMGKAVLSPTRTYYPVIAKILKENSQKIVGMIHCTGGGQVKCAGFSQNIHFVKDNLFDFPPLFQKLSEKNPIKEMFKIFNCGHRMELYTDETTAKEIIDISHSFNIPAKVIGYTDNSSLGNQVSISYQGEKFIYTGDF